MKFNVPVLLLGLQILPVLSSCIREDLSQCNPGSVNLLEMSYLGDGTTEIFHDKISRVDMYVFDSRGTCVSTSTLPDDQMASRIAELPPLGPGDYHVVCLGNPHNTIVDRLSSGDYSQIVFMDRAYYENSTVSGNDALYFAAIDYRVTAEDQRRLLEFESSHYYLSVEVAGVPAPATKSYDHPYIMVSGLSPHTSFENEAGGEMTEYLLESTHDADRKYLSASANIMRHSDHSAVDVSVMSAGGDTLASINLEEFLADNPEVDCSRQEVVIPIYIEFKSGDVTVRLPDWYVEEVNPEF